MKIDRRKSVVSKSKRLESESGNLSNSVRSNKERLVNVDFVTVTTELFDKIIIDTISRIVTRKFKSIADCMLKIGKCHFFIWPVNCNNEMLRAIRC